MIAQQNIKVASLQIIIQFAGEKILKSLNIGRTCKQKG